MTTTTTIRCFICNQTFENNADLARHIISAKNHNNRKSRVWALAYLTSVKDKIELKHFDKDPDYQPTEFGDMNRENRRVQLSGETLNATAFCPKCKQKHRTTMEVEYLEEPHIWRISGLIVRTCCVCEVNRKQFAHY